MSLLAGVEVVTGQADLRFGEGAAEERAHVVVAAES